jgi:cysteine-rich repeat protein
MASSNRGGTWLPVSRRTFAALSIAVALASAAQPRTGCAAVDMTGDWYASSADYGPVSAVHFSQTGSSLALGAVATGTIDSATGAFMLTFPFMGPAACGGPFQGQTDPAGNTFVATGTIFFTPQDCQSISCACSGSMPTELRGSRSPCGNGVVDAGEQCDDGNLGRNGDCCALGCTVRPNGASCSDGLFCNGQETTCQAGVCQTGAPPCPFQCNEGNRTCVSVCPSAPLTCRTAGTSRLAVKRTVGGNKDTLAWRWSQGASTSQAEFADPTTSADYALCVFAGLSPALIGEAVVPASATSWRATVTTGYRYKDAAATADGVTKVTLKASTVNKSRVQVTGKGVGLPDLSLPLTAPVTVQLVNETTGLCWGAIFSGQELTRNEPDQVKAKTP